MRGLFPALLLALALPARADTRVARRGGPDEATAPGPRPGPADGGLLCPPPPGPGAPRPPPPPRRPGGGPRRGTGARAPAGAGDRGALLHPDAGPVRRDRRPARGAPRAPPGAAARRLSA